MSDHDLKEAREALGAAEGAMRRSGNTERAAAWASIAAGWVDVHRADVEVGSHREL